MQQESVALNMFLQTKKIADVTKKEYLYFLDKFLAWSELPSYDSIVHLEGGTKAQTALVRKYVAHLEKEGRSYPYVTLAVFPIFKFFYRNDITINEKLIKDDFPPSGKKGGGNAYTPEQIRAIISEIEKSGKKRKLTTLRNIAIVYFLTSSGCRLGALPELKLTDLIPHISCYAVKVYNDDKAEYLTFISPQARKALDEYLTERSKSGYIVKDPKSVFDIKRAALVKVIERYVNKAGFRVKLDSSRSYKNYNIPAAHGFRKYLGTVMKSTVKIDHETSEMLLGHKSKTLELSYNKATVDNLYAEYSKCIKPLTI